jgi:hypothetical protein
MNASITSPRIVSLRDESELKITELSSNQIIKTLDLPTKSDLHTYETQQILDIFIDKLKQEKNNSNIFFILNDLKMYISLIKNSIFSFQDFIIIIDILIEKKS